MSEISDLKVGDRRVYNSGDGVPFTINAIGKYKALYSYIDSFVEHDDIIEEIIKNSKPYQEPKPSPKLVAHYSPEMGIGFCFEDDEVCKDRDGMSGVKRVDNIKELLFGSTK